MRTKVHVTSFNCTFCVQKHDRQPWFSKWTKPLLNSQLISFHTQLFTQHISFIFLNTKALCDDATKAIGQERQNLLQIPWNFNLPCTNTKNGSMHEQTVLLIYHFWLCICTAWNLTAVIALKIWDIVKANMSKMKNKNKKGCILFIRRKKYENDFQIKTAWTYQVDRYFFSCIPSLS